MKLGPFKIGEEEENSKAFSSTGQMRSLMKQIAMAISPFVAVAILGGAVPIQYAFWAQVIFFALYLIGVVAAYLNWQRDAIVHLCFAYVHAWVYNVPLPPRCWFIQGEPVVLDADDNLKSFLTHAKSIKPEVQADLRKAFELYNSYKGCGHFTGFHLMERILAGPYQGFDNIVTITKSPGAETFGFLMNCEVLFHDIPVQHPRCQLAAFQIVSFVEVMGERTAFAYVLESSLKVASTSQTFKGKEAEAGIIALLLNHLSGIAKFTEDQAAHLQGILKFQDDRQGFVDENISWLVEKYRSVGSIPTKGLLQRLKFKHWVLIVAVVGFILLASYMGWLPRFSWK